ncbi:TetR/AcrR family transcriptional regulator [Nocardiopsis salina]|uniref:TetR/AcrR family transcriptional regulator n=1 Tax=Nocardiopsis salina TaxID=245836 RepID=UPI00034579FF|nr:TetR/AcrR family transcriptional regulator [Nocardiopsis salina]
MAPHERRDDLIRSALRVFARRPPAEVTPEEIAAEADVSRALVYRYFPNMAELRRATLQHAMGELLAELEPPEDLPTLEQLRVALRTFISFAHSYAPAYPALMGGGSVIATEETEAEIDRVREGVRDLLLDRSGVEKPSPQLSLAIRCWVASVETAVMLWLSEPVMERDALADWLLDQLVAMVAAAGGPQEEMEHLIARVE